MEKFSWRYLTLLKRGSTKKRCLTSQQKQPSRLTVTFMLQMDMVHNISCNFHLPENLSANLAARVREMKTSAPRTVFVLTIATRVILLCCARLAHTIPSNVFHSMANTFRRYFCLGLSSADL